MMYVVSSSSSSPPISFPPLPKPRNPQIPTNLTAQTSSSSSYQSNINGAAIDATAAAVIRTSTALTKHSLLTTIFKSMDDLICTFMDASPLPPSIDPRRVLSGNFAPVGELPPTPCRVADGGALPAALDGAYIRNGPNPQFVPATGPYHLFDGDGMLHCVRISDGTATFCSRYVRTHKFVVEMELGHPILPSPFSSFNGLWASLARSAMAVARAAAGFFDPRRTGFGTANTSLALIGGRLFALCETDLPYAVKVTPAGDIVTGGRQGFDSGAGDPPLRMTAHPKTDPATRETFAFSCDIFPPFLTFFKIDSRRSKLAVAAGGGCGVAISTAGPSFVHDFAVTERFIVFEDIQVVVRAAEIVRGRSPVVYDGGKRPRVGILPRRAEDERELVWVEAPGFNMMHVINAWDEDSGGRVVVVAPNVLSIEDGLERISSFRSVVERVAIDVRTKEVVGRQALCPKMNLEFGVINPAYAGKQNRYVYAAIIEEMPKAAGIVKLDLQSPTTWPDCTVASRVYGPGCYGGEPQFVARDPETPGAAEDDGYLVTYMHDEHREESWLLIMDAKSEDLDIVAKVRLPGRVPYGFHGLFVKESYLIN
ncbi:probable carotenoid cleavage dioxygenase 4, chloroplastic [Andrographis paniculata]|uniref:probable carotenoid cleavage dioxygenase 4, chloroplastic n=1 Tax=Andrographis paniculata TaxID=175694 RepID=UPI0021E8C0D5|nr:probable carotenoid cleavage dioxygenase 4, chloroplastic [Andrographis paniculata]